MYIHQDFFLTLGFYRDIARIYGKNVKPSLLESPLNHMVIENSKGLLYFSKGTREMAHWAQQVCLSLVFRSRQLNLFFLL